MSRFARVLSCFELKSLCISQRPKMQAWRTQMQVIWLFASSKGSLFEDVLQKKAETFIFASVFLGFLYFHVTRKRRNTNVHTHVNPKATSRQPPCARVHVVRCYVRRWIIWFIIKGWLVSLAYHRRYSRPPRTSPTSLHASVLSAPRRSRSPA